MKRHTQPEQHRSFLASGGWVILIALLAVTAVFVWTLNRWLATTQRAVGDGRTVESYGFVLDPCLAPRDTLVASGMPKDGLRTLTEPEVWPLSHLDQLSHRRYRKLLLDSDLVAGVVLAGKSRAYPLRFLAWHEVVNDTLAEVPIAVTSHPISGTVAVFDRRVADDTLQFSVSGLLSNSSQVLYDRRPNPDAESLWSQLLMRAIAGPAARARHTLQLLPVTVAPWSWWRQRHPDTTLLAPDERLLRDYRRNPYSSYFGSDLLRYPVDPLPRSNRLPLKTPLVAVGLADGFHAFTLPFLAAGTDVGSKTVTIGNVTMRFYWQGRPTHLWLEQPDQPLPVVHSLLFAWYAAQGTETTWHGLASDQ